MFDSKMIDIGVCANCGKNRSLYMKVAFRDDKQLHTLESKSPCCLKCFQKEFKRQFKTLKGVDINAG